MKTATGMLEQRLRRDRYFGWALAVAAIASAAALLAVVGFLLAGALPLLDWRGPAVERVAQWPMPTQPDQLLLSESLAPRSIGISAVLADGALRALQSRPLDELELCATLGGRRSCYWPNTEAGTIELGMTSSACTDCEPSVANRASVSLPAWQTMVLLSDQRSLLVADAAGHLLLLQPFRDALGQLNLETVVRWDSIGAAVVALQRIGAADLLLALDAEGAVSLIDPSQQRWKKLDVGPLQLADDRIYLSDDRLLLWQSGQLSAYQFLRLDTPPLIDLWQPLRSPGQADARALWQPHSDDGAGTPRLNLLPLVLGSLKAALLGLLFGAPLAIAAAMHTVQYRSGLWRDGFKSSFELMEAVPTVILGLIAGLWVAPWLDQHLGMALGAAGGWLAVFLWPTADPRKEQNDRNRAVQTVLRCAFGLTAGGVLGAIAESQLPGGRLTTWMDLRLGWSYEPYNAVVVGLLVGLAIAPMIYSLAEEALRRAPAGLQEAALALGANRRDTLFGLLLPAALPGIIVATLMGFGRALGETLIVLLASNNAPIADLNPLSGLRSITATLVLEAPTAIPGSVHYRVLLLATLLLMATTIGLNLLATRWRARMARKPVTVRVGKGR